ncbi:MAG: hypothetical protein BZ151_11965 [Desulfobacca sp. 4484_104]|nr:MAG: hypothetical protein BZ151_11965 [Desulfobacca sp. 4484_104]
MRALQKLWGVGLLFFVLIFLSKPALAIDANDLLELLVEEKVITADKAQKLKEKAEKLDRARQARESAKRAQELEQIKQDAQAQDRGRLQEGLLYADPG